MPNLGDVEVITRFDVHSKRELGRLGISSVPLGWQLADVGSACEIRNDLRLPLSVEVRSLMSGEYPYYGPTGVLSHINAYRADGDFALIGEDGDHFLDSQSKPQTIRISGKFNVNNHAHLVGTGPLCDVDWFLYFFQHRDIASYLTRQGAGRYKLTKATLERLPILLPPRFEQQAIAEILRTWDNAIGKATELIEAKQAQYDTSSRNFFDFCHPALERPTGNWTKFTMGDLFRERVEQGTKEDVLLSITMSGGVIDRDDVGRRDSSSKDKSKYKLVMLGDIAYNTMRMWQGVSGLSSLRGIVSPAYTVLIPEQQRISSRYAAHLFKSKRMIHDFERYSQGLTSDTWNLKYSVFAEITVFLPSIHEQKRQADLLDAMGDEISLIKWQVDALADQKRGLMQKLLTGEWRVPC